MTEQRVRLHDVSISGDVDSRAVLAAIERAVAAATQTGRPTTQVVQRAVAEAVTESRKP